MSYFYLLGLSTDMQGQPHVTQYYYHVQYCFYAHLEVIGCFDLSWKVVGL